jgi:hypothetical protein
MNSTTYKPRSLAGRCADGAERDSGRLYHAIRDDESVAVCGAKPGRMSAGWGDALGGAVTCARCQRKLAART